MRRYPFLVAMLFAAACTSQAAGGPATPARTTPGAVRFTTPTVSAQPGLTATVEMGDHFYIPSLLTVKVGTTVTWRMGGMQEHDVIAYDGSFHSPTMTFGSRFSHTFTKPGRYPYFCAPHYGDGMVGEVVVESGPP
jgi:plastocyanin